MLEALAPYLDESSDQLFLFGLIFFRVAATAALLPGFGERSIPSRIRLGVALAFAVMIWPLVQSTQDISGIRESTYLLLILTEIGIGLAFGLSIRFLVLALQLCGSIAAQTTSLAQVMGSSATPDPMPAMGNILVVAGLALALIADLHIKVVLAINATYQIFPIGRIPAATELTEWGIAHASTAFSIAFTLAAPFVIASIAYNLTLGAINRAMPQLMVAFIGAPAITLGSVFILFLSAPLLLTVWLGNLSSVIEAPFEMPK
jgi:flagellar biosynthetic protein FliR